MKITNAIVRVVMVSAICSAPVLAAGSMKFSQIESSPDEEIVIKRQKLTYSRIRSVVREPAAVVLLERSDGLTTPLPSTYGQRTVQSQSAPGTRLGRSPGADGRRVHIAPSGRVTFARGS